MKVSVTVKPGSAHEKVEQSENGYVAHVKAPPVENKANEALVKLLAEHFGVSKSQVTIVSGAKSKRKIVQIGTA